MKDGKHGQLRSICSKINLSLKYQAPRQKRQKRLTTDLPVLRPGKGNQQNPTIIIFCTKKKLPTSSLDAYLV